MTYGKRRSGRGGLLDYYDTLDQSDLLNDGKSSSLYKIPILLLSLAPSAVMNSIIWVGTRIYFGFSGATYYSYFLFSLVLLKGTSDYIFTFFFYLFLHLVRILACLPAQKS